MAVVLKVLVCSFLFLGIHGRPEGVNPHTFFNDGPGRLTGLLNPRNMLEIAARLLYPFTNGVNGIVGRLGGANNRIPPNYLYDLDSYEIDDSAYFFPRTNNPEQGDGLFNIQSLYAPTDPENDDSNQINEVDIRFGEPAEASKEDNENSNNNAESDKNKGDEDAKNMKEDEASPLPPILVDQPSVDETPTDGEVRQRKSLTMGPSDVDNNANPLAVQSPKHGYAPVSNSPSPNNFFIPISSVNPSKPSYPNNGGSNVPGGAWNNGYVPGNVNSPVNNQPIWVAINNPSSVNPGTSSGKPTYVPVYWINNPGQPNGNPNNSGYYVVLGNDGSYKPVSFIPGNSGSSINFAPGNGGTGVNIPISFIPTNSGSQGQIPAGYIPVNTEGLGGNTPIYFVPANNRPGGNTPITFVPANEAPGNHVSYVPVNIGPEGNNPGSFVVNNEPGANRPTYVPPYEAPRTNNPNDFMHSNENSDGTSSGIMSTSYLEPNKDGDEDNADN